MEQQTKHLGRSRVRPGQSLFALHLKEGYIVNMGKPRQVVCEENVVYRIALNRKNFIRKLRQDGIVLTQIKQE